MTSASNGSLNNVSIPLSSTDSRRVYFPAEEEAATFFALQTERASVLPDLGLPLLFDTDQNAIFLAIVWHAGILGAATYNSETASVDLLMDVPDNPPFDVLRALIANFKPGHLIFSQNMDVRVKDHLLEIGNHNGQRNEIDSVENQALDLTKAEPPQLKVMSNKEFALGLCRQRIDRIRLPSMPPHFVEIDSIRTYLASLIDFRRTAMIRALGGLLHYLDKRPQPTAENNGPNTFPIVSLRMFSMEDSVSIDENSQRALRIFHADTHPSVFQAGKAKKEGLSLFALFNRCRSAIGSKMLRYWFTRPTRNFAVIRDRQQAVRFFMSDENVVMKKELEKLLGSIKDVTRALGRMAKGASSLTDWTALQRTAACAFGISRLIGDECMPQDIEVFGKIVDHFTKDLARIAKIIQEVVDFEASAIEERFVVNPSIAPELDELKQTLYNLNETLTLIAAEELIKMTDSAREIRVTYIPHLGYLMVLQETEDLARDGYDMPGLDFVFKAKNGLFYKSERMRQLDEEYGDIVPKIHDCEQIIMIQLQEIVLRYSKLFMDVMKYTAELDCVIAMASVASARSYCIPVLGDDLGIDIVNGRHPLQELYVPSFISNDIRVAQSTGRITVVTGPNMSGKSVYLKQIGIIVFLAHIGCPVPAERARIGFVDKIFTRLLTEESVALRQSALLIDLTQVAFAVNYATRRSLVILDEFGKGTRATDGLALVAAILDHFVSGSGNSLAPNVSATADAENTRSSPCSRSSRAAESPVIFLATHFHALDELVPPSESVIYKKMQHTTADGGQVVFLFKVDSGKSGSSHAIEISKLAGFPESILNRISETAQSLQFNRAIKPLASLQKISFCEKAHSVMTELVRLDPVAEDARAFLDRINHLLRSDADENIPSAALEENQQ